MNQGNTESVSSRSPGIAHRFLSLFSDVRAGEAGVVLLMLLNIFLILLCYYIIKTIREPLVLAGGQAEVKTYASAAQAVILMIFIPLYGWFASRVDRMKLIIGVTLFFVVNIELFALGVWVDVPSIGVVFFIWVGFFSLAIIAQFWSYANDIYTKQAGDRLFPVIVVGMTAGAPVGSKVAEMMFSGGVQIFSMLQISAAVLLTTLFIYWFVNRKGLLTGEASEVERTSPLKAGNGFALIFNSSYLRLVALIFILLNVVNTTGEYVLSQLVLDHADAVVAGDPGIDKGAVIGAFYGNFFFWVNIVAVLTQAFLVSRIVKYIGIAGVLLALPCIALGTYGLLASGVAFVAFRWAKTAENSTDYSVMNTGRQLIWLPLSREEKYNAKQAVDTFFVRFGDVLSAGVVFVGLNFLSLNLAGFAIVNIVVIILWIIVTVLVIRENKRLAGLEETSGN